MVFPQCTHAPCRQESMIQAAMEKDNLPKAPDGAGEAEDMDMLEGEEEEGGEDDVEDDALEEG